MLHWTPDEIKNSYIPILDEKLQKSIGEKYKEFLSIRRNTLNNIKAKISELEIEIEKNINS